MNFLETLLEFLREFWPFVKVQQWERGIVFLFGHALQKTVGPGVYPILPWFTSIETVSMVPAPVSTPLLNITLRDNKTLSYSATAIVRVVDARAALIEIDDYQESVSELVASKTSEKLAEVDALRVEVSARPRLLTDLLRWVNAETKLYGVEVTALRFTNFALNQKTFRLLQDPAIGSMKW